MTAGTGSGTAVVTLPTDTQILITREFEAPKHPVYRAWTTPELIERWWHAEALCTLGLTERDGRTTLSVLVEHTDMHTRDAHIASGMEAGLRDALNLLEQVAVSLR
jgi:hypothetical protein